MSQTVCKVMSVTESPFILPCHAMESQSHALYALAVALSVSCTECLGRCSLSLMHCMPWPLLSQSHALYALAVALSVSCTVCLGHCSLSLMHCMPWPLLSQSHALYALAVALSVSCTVCLGHCAFNLYACHLGLKCCEAPLLYLFIILPISTN